MRVNSLAFSDYNKDNGKSKQFLAVFGVFLRKTLPHQLLVCFRPDLYHILGPERVFPPFIRARKASPSGLFHGKHFGGRAPPMFHVKHFAGADPIVSRETSLPGFFADVSRETFFWNRPAYGKRFLIVSRETLHLPSIAVIIYG